MDDRTVDDAPLPDETLAERQTLTRLERLGRRLVAVLASDDPEAHRVLELRATGMEKPAEIADAMGITPEAVYDADQRMRYHARRILDEERASAAAIRDPSTRPEVPE